MSETHQQTSVKLTTTLEKDAVIYPSTVDGLFMASLKAPNFQADKRSPLDLICAVDRSGSMSGSKMTLTKQTLRYVVSQLTSVDRLGIVSYDNEIETPLVLTNMDESGKNLANHAIDKIEARGGTDLCGGLVKGIEWMRKRTTKNEVSSVLVFTDGLANEGYTQLRDIIRAMSDPDFASKSKHARYNSYPIPYQQPIYPMQQLQQMPNVNFAPMQQQQQKVQQMPNVNFPPMNRNNYSNSPQLQQVQQMPNVNFPPMNNNISPMNIQAPQLQQQVQQMPNVNFPPMNNNNASPMNFQAPQQQQQVQQMPNFTFSNSPMNYQSPQVQQMPTESFPPIETESTDASKNEPLTCTVNTFGFGSDHDPNLLKGIAEHGNGIYYFIQNGDNISESFADCLGGLLSVCGQNISLKIEACNDVKIKKVVTKFKLNTLVENQSYEVVIGDIQSDESRDILVSVSYPALSAPQEKFEVAKVTLNYFNVIDTKLETSSTTAIIARPTTVPADLKSNYEVDKQNNRLLSAEAMEKATAAGNSNNLSLAREILNGAISRVKNSVSAEDTFCKGLVTDLETCLGTLRDQSTYNQVGQQYLNNNVHAHYNQRSSNVNFASQSAYQTPSRNMQQQQQQMFKP